MFISEAYAQAAGAPGGADMLTSFLPLVLIFVVFWFLMIRPQQKRMKEHRALVAALKKGDKVLTSGGILGLVTKAVEGENDVEVEIAANVRVRVVRTAVSEVLNRPGVAAKGGKADEKAKAVESKSGANDA
ncbi:MAG: preprotein translocase subunit YajC [Rhodospirillaceae bacterium]|nr:preprotein translocase subunit YajC [Rhodospirillaceae bacterium]